MLIAPQCSRGTTNGLFTILPCRNPEFCLSAHAWHGTEPLPACPRPGAMALFTLPLGTIAGEKEFSLQKEELLKSQLESPLPRLCC